MIFQTRSSADVCDENRLQMSGMNFGYVTENGVNSNVMIKICLLLKMLHCKMKFRVDKYSFRW